MKYRKKPVVIEAIQWDGTNYEEICEFVGTSLERDARELYKGEASNLLIQTLEGTMEARIYDYIVKGVKGEFYPCKPDIFAETYELDNKYVGIN